VVDPRLSAMYASGGCCGDSSGAGFPPPEGGRWSPSLLQQRHESNPRRAPLSTSTPSSESVDQPPAAGVAANLDRTSRDANGGGAGGGGGGSVRTGPHQQQQPTQPRAFSCLVRASTRSLVTKDWKHSTFLLHQVLRENHMLQSERNRRWGGGYVSNQPCVPLTLIYLRLLTTSLTRYLHKISETPLHLPTHPLPTSNTPSLVSTL